MSESNPIARIETSMGNITLELDATNAPITVANFIDYANDGFYEDTIFHRVIDGFMVQGGGLTADMSDKDSKKAPIKNEAGNGLKNDLGTVAMARTNVVDSATSQFFINVGANSFLNHTAPTPQGFGYAVFGKVTDGMDFVDAIRQVKTGNSGMHQDVPVETITIQKVTVEQ
jgi:cyclophilin family peptidyl-prolyl cis-trans isomerase